MCRSIPILLILFVLALLPACRRGSAPSAGAPASVAPLPAEALLYYDNSGGIQDSVRLVVRDTEAFARLWAQATSTQASPPPLPTVDFSREMVLVIGAGRMTPEDVIRVDSLGVREEATPGSGSQRILEAVVRTLQGCQGFTSDAYPLAIVRVRSFEGEVRFSERRGRTEGCGTSSVSPWPDDARQRVGP